MKAKYEKMIDEYVKKHYGDLDRGVLSPEVKYKVLFKLYRKKYKKEKALCKSLEKMHRYAPTVLPKEEAHAGYWGKLNEFEDKTQKEMKTCDRCKYSTFKTVTNGREAATGKLWCTKNDFETSGVTSCDWFEDKEDSYLDWMHDDITWCCRECSDLACERNNKNRRCKEGLFSAADMFDPFKCPVDAEMPKNNP